MGHENTGDVTRLLQSAARGDRRAVGQIYAILYPELKAMAHRRVRHEASGGALDTTALVHESYLRLVNRDNVNLENRRHFMAYAAHVMRSVVVDFVRQARARRRGGDQLQVTFNTNLADSLESSERNRASRRTVGRTGKNRAAAGGRGRDAAISRLSKCRKSPNTSMSATAPYSET